MVSYVVVGASRGIGLGFVQALSTDPRNKVFAVVRNAETASPLREFVESEATSKNVVILQADLTDYNTLKLAAEEVSKATGGILDVLINNGALVIHEKGMLTIDAFPDEETLEKDFLDFFKTNVVGVTHAINAFLPLLRAGNSKKVLTISSSMGSPRTNLASNHDTLVSYAVSKAALNMVVVNFAARFKQEGLTFLSVSPGLVKTMSGPADEIDKVYDAITARIRTADPTFPGPITVEKSVKDQLALLERVTPSDSGAFIHPNGDDANFVTY